MLNGAFEYFAPTDLQEAVQMFGHFGGKASILAGGTDLILAIQKANIICDALIDISKINDLKQIKKTGSFLSVGAAVTFADLINSPLVQEWAPLVAQAASEVGSPQIRNRGTIGGNMATASPAGDLLTPLVAMEGETIVFGPGGKRQLLVEKLLHGKDDDKLQADEIICEIMIPVTDCTDCSELRSAFIKLGRRNALAISRLSLALYLKVKENAVLLARLAVGAAAPVPFRVLGAEQILMANEDFKPQELMDEVSRAVANALGDRPSAPYKMVAVKGLAWEALVRCGLVK